MCVTPQLLVWSGIIDAMDFENRPNARRFYLQLQRFILTLEVAELTPLNGYYEALDTNDHLMATMFCCTMAKDIPDIIIKQTFVSLSFVARS